jgi:cytochrome c
LHFLIIGILLGPVTFAAAHAADPDSGQKGFVSQCTICHSPVAGRTILGPSLFDVVGRKAGSVRGYPYSSANKNSGLTWDQATLDKYLQNPQQWSPAPKMTYAGLKDAAKCADLIAYLATLH